MPGKVVDASALGALAFGEPELELIRAQLSGYDLLAPALLPFELANIAWKKQTREPGQAELLAERFAEALALPIELREADGPALYRLAIETGLTAYDAAYLLLAEQLELELVTLDNTLREAWERRR